MKVGQRCVSEREPELGLGVVTTLEDGRIGIAFSATGEQRLYARGTPVLKRVQFRAGDTVATRDHRSFVIEQVEEEEGLLVYVGQGERVREDEISDVTNVNSPVERLLSGQADENEVFDLRRATLETRARLRRSPVRGFLGGRVELLPHQMYILREVAGRALPRVLLADEVGLGKTIEACLILQRLLAVGRIRRVLVLVPEPLVHQWFVELLRRFNLWFSIYDAERCAALEASDPGSNPFEASQLALCSLSFLAGEEERAGQALAAGWDMVVVDEAHHLAWSPENPSREYQLVEALGAGERGLLLLTATPTQLGVAGHFARLRLLDPNRFTDLDAFQSEMTQYGRVAAVAQKLADRKPLTATDQKHLRQLFSRGRQRLEAQLTALTRGAPGAHEALLRLLLDRHGPGRVVFRNTRAAMTGFPVRQFCPVPLPLEPASLRARGARELLAEETGDEASIRYSFREDPRIEWLADQLRAQRETKYLLICRNQRKVAAIEAALQEHIHARVALFHEGLPLVQRDRQAAWFAEPDGAQLLLCSEIGSEGRNFQFAHHLILFDLPLSPGLVEQRIGRLDRIGQTETIRIHVPYIEGTAEACVVEWYHRGLAAFERPLHGGDAYEERFRARLLDLAVAFESGARAPGPAELSALVDETVAFRAELLEKLERGRDRLLELNSFRPDVAEQVIHEIRAAEADSEVRERLHALLDHFGVRIQEHEGGELFLDPRHAYVEAFPSLPADGMLATFSRARALAREDIRFLTADHPLMRDAMDLLVGSPAGTSAFGLIPDTKPDLLIEAVFLLEAVADTTLHVDAFLAPTPVRVVVDLRKRDRTADWPTTRVEQEVEDAPIEPFLEQGRLPAPVLEGLVQVAAERADARAAALRRDSLAQAEASTSEELQRLIELREVNEQVRPEEIASVEQRRSQLRVEIERARLRLDSIRLLLVGPLPR